MSDSDPLLEAIVNHIILPPRLPGQQDREIKEVDRHLTILLLEATRHLRALTTDKSPQALDDIELSLESCCEINEDGRLTETSLLNAFRGLHGKHGLILHIAAQNAGLLVYRENR
jgi:hypothetical protein